LLIVLYFVPRSPDFLPRPHARFTERPACAAHPAFASGAKENCRSRDSASPANANVRTFFFGVQEKICRKIVAGKIGEGFVVVRGSVALDRSAEKT
jgi:hypothetical protein